MPKLRIDKPEKMNTPRGPQLKAPLLPWSHSGLCATNQPKDVQRGSNIVPHGMQQEVYYTSRSTKMPANGGKDTST
jgi:hypothetical protein